MGSGYLVRRGVVGSSSEVTVTFDIQNVKIFRRGLTSLITPVYNLAATTVGDYALFGGGSSGNTYYSTVDAYDTNLVRSSMDNLLEVRSGLAATTVGKYALFGGGNDGGSLCSDDVDIYTFDSTIQVYPGTKYKFNNMVEEETATEWKEITFDEPLNGYIKISNVEIIFLNSFSDSPEMSNVRNSKI